MNVKIDFNNLARQLVPSHKRQPVRLSLLRALLRPLVWLLRLFDAWRNGIRREVNMTGQVGILEGYLRHKYATQTIRIETCTEKGLPFGLEVEGVANAQPIGKDTFDTHPTTHALCPAVIPLQSELQERYGDVDFVVYIKQGIDIEAIRIDIERFKQVLVTYKIIEQ